MVPKGISYTKPQVLGKECQNLESLSDPRPLVNLNGHWED